jgi:hypothetical protein
MDTITGRRLDQQGMEDCPEGVSEIYQEVAYRLGVLELDNPDGLFASASRDIFSQMRSPNKRSFKQRKNPHGHNSL